LGNNIIDTIPVAYGETETLLRQAVQEQSDMGWEKILVGMASHTWRTLQDFIDANNPRKPQRSASEWMNVVSHQFLKFCMRCWKQRNITVHGATRQEQQQLALNRVRERITHIYESPPSLDPRYRSIFAIPLVHRLKMPLQAAEQWVSMITHQVKVTSHNLRILLSQHKPIESHFRTMRREARQQAKDRRLPISPRKAHSRAVQDAVKIMRAKLYAPKGLDVKQRKRRRSDFGKSSKPRKARNDTTTLSTASTTTGQPSLRRHPP